MTRALFLALLAGACASGQAAPISYGGGAPAPSRQMPPPETTARTPAVQERAPDWAAGEGTPLSAYALQPSEAHPFDPAHLPRSHTVSGAESLYDIATLYQIPMLALIDQNGLEPPYVLHRGQALRLPPPRFHTVTRGESFEDVARRYNVDTRSLALLNRMQPPYSVRAGDRVVLPAMASANPPPLAGEGSEASNPRGASATTPPSVSQRSTAPPQTGERARFAWPLRGEIVAGYGAQPSGERLDGVEIAGREGDAIVAAAEGDVVYAGADLPAYGTLVLVRHADNYVTAYAHARRALVREGQHVRAGQRIAELGARADGRPRLLFQVRLGTAAVDPTPLLGAGF